MSAHFERMTETVRKRVMDCYKLMQKDVRRRDILNYITSKYSVAYSTAEGDYKKAKDMILEDMQEKIEAARHRRILGLETDAKRAYANYESSSDPKDKIAWFKLYQDSKIRADKYYKNDLKPEEEDKSLNISIQYEELIKPDSDEDNG